MWSANTIIVIPTFISNLITDQKTELFTKIYHLTYSFNISYNYMICLFVSSVNHWVSIWYTIANSSNFWLFLLIIFNLKMLVNNFDTLLSNIEKIIKKTVIILKKVGFKDMDLWKTFQYNFEEFINNSLRSASINYQHKLETHL